MRIRVIAGALLAAVLTAPAEAAWVTENKKKVTPVQGFQNSVEGALTNAMPWNWGEWMFPKPKPRKGAYQTRLHNQ